MNLLESYILEVKSVNPIKVNFETDKEWLQVDWVLDSYNGIERKFDIITQEEYNESIKQGFIWR